MVQNITNSSKWRCNELGSALPPGRRPRRRPLTVSAHTSHCAVCAARVWSCNSVVASVGSAPQLVTSVRRSVPTARHASSVEGVRRARPLHGHGASRADHPRRTVQLGAAISALEWVAPVTHSPRFDERLMLACAWQAATPVRPNSRAACMQREANGSHRAAP